MRLIREHFDIFRDYIDKPGLNARSLDDATTFRLKRNAFRIVIREYYKKDKKNEDKSIDRSNPVTYLRYYLDNNVEALQDIVFSIYDHAQSQPDPEGWIARQMQRADSEIPDYWLDSFFGTENHPGELIPKIKKILKATDSFKKKVPQDLLDKISAHTRKLLEDPTRENQIEFLKMIGSLSEDLSQIFMNNPCQDLMEYYSFYKNLKADWDDTRWIITQLIRLT